MSRCECTIPGGGFCDRHGVDKSAHWVGLCQGRKLAYWRAWELGIGPGQRQAARMPAPQREWDPSMPSRGLGDTVARVASAIGMKPCGGCKGRQNTLNRWWPYRPKAARLRVGFLTPTLLFGGAERWVAALAVGLDPARFDVVGVAVRDRHRIFPAIGKSIRRLSGCTIREGPGSFIQLAKQCNPGVLIAWGLHDLSMLAGYGGRVVMVGHGHCDWTVKAIRACLPYVTDCAAVSRHAAESFPDPANVAIVHNGIDVDRCDPHRTREEVRAEWGLRPGEIAVGHVGRLSAEKNPLAAMRAVQALNQEDRHSCLSCSAGKSRYRAVIVGGGIAEDRQIEAARESVPDLIYRPAVENVGDIYRALDCFVLASRSEGFSLALTEAWYCGCPTVATPVGATELQELHGDLYIPVPVGATPEQLAAAIRLALAAENQPLVFRVSRVVAEHYTAAAMCRRWEAYLERITAPAPAASGVP
jgi:glycosyltransferase involved in cell wall biosynthesis